MVQCEPINSINALRSSMEKPYEFPAKIDARWRIQVPIELRENLQKGKENNKTYRIKIEEA